MMESNPDLPRTLTHLPAHWLLRSPIHTNALASVGGQKIELYTLALGYTAPPQEI